MATFAATVTALSPYSFHRCQDTSGAVLADSSGLSHPGTIFGTVYYSSAALVSDGNPAASITMATNPTAAYVSPPNTAPGTSNAAFTNMFCWKILQTGISYVAGSGNSTGSAGWNIAIDGTYIYLCINRDGYSSTLYNARATYAAANIALNVVQMFWVTYDGTGAWNVYKNGDSTPIMTVAGVAMVSPATPGLSFGGYISTTYSCGGLFAEVATFSSVVSGANRSAVFASTGISSISPVSITPTNTQTGVSFSWTAAVGGTAPYNYNLSRGLIPLVSNATYATVYNGTSTTATDTPPDGQLYYYRLIVTDSSTTPASQSVTLVTGAISPNVLICAIGDSRTIGYPLSPPQDGVSQLKGYLNDMAQPITVTISNAAIGGTTSAQWVTGSSNLNGAITQFTTAANALPTGGKVYLQICFGINDASTTSRLSVATWTSNMQNMIAGLKAASIPKLAGILIHQSFFAVPNGVNANYDEACLALVIQYNAAIPSLTDGVTVFIGDTQSYEFFAFNPTLMGDKLHPNAAGYQALGQIWTTPYMKLIAPSVIGSSGSSGTRSRTGLFRY